MRGRAAPAAHGLRNRALAVCRSYIFLEVFGKRQLSGFSCSQRKTLQGTAWRRCSPSSPPPAGVSPGLLRSPLARRGAPSTCCPCSHQLSWSERRPRACCVHSKAAHQAHAAGELFERQVLGAGVGAEKATEERKQGARRSHVLLSQLTTRTHPPRRPPLTICSSPEPSEQLCLTQSCSSRRGCSPGPRLAAPVHLYEPQGKK